MKKANKILLDFIRSRAKIYKIKKYFFVKGGCTTFADIYHEFKSHIKKCFIMIFKAIEPPKVPTLMGVLRYCIVTK